MRQRTLRFVFGDCRSLYFHSLIESAFLVSNGLLCLYDKKSNTGLLVDMKFLFSCSTRKRYSIFKPAHALFSISCYFITMNFYSILRILPNCFNVEQVTPLKIELFSTTNNSDPFLNGKGFLSTDHQSA